MSDSGGAGEVVVVMFGRPSLAVDLSAARQARRRSAKGENAGSNAYPRCFIDGLWSACGGERIIIFTTNHKEKLDPALIRRGRMDMHIEMSYCCFEGFKVLAKNYLGVAEHELFGDIRRLLEEVEMTPADVAENLMPRSKKKDVDACLWKLVKALKEAKEAALAKALAGNKEDGADEDEEEENSEDGSTSSSDDDSDEEDSKKKEMSKDSNKKG
ncbi:hypothetical protein ACP70R_050093 [Stipagrostis hirtigluma subsp. patula]